MNDEQPILNVFDRQFIKILGKSVWLDLITVQRCMSLRYEHDLSSIESSLAKLVACDVAETCEHKGTRQWRLAKK